MLIDESAKRTLSSVENDIPPKSRQAGRRWIKKLFRKTNISTSPPHLI